MDFNLKVKVTNLGTIDNAELELNSMTIFAGLNNTGKSYVSKFLYSFLDTLNVDVGPAYLKDLTNDINAHDNLSLTIQSFILNKDDISAQDRDYLQKIYKHTPKFKSIVDDNQKAIDLLLRNTPSDEIISKLDAFVEERFLPRKDAFLAILKEISKPDNIFWQSVSDENKERFFEELDRGQERIQKIIDYKSIYTDEDAIKKTYESSLTYNLVHNFQMSDASQLIGKDPNSPTIVEIVSLDNSSEKITCTINQNGEVTLSYDSGNPLFSILREHFSRVIYLESPVYWKLESTLKRIRNYIAPRFRSDDEGAFLSGVPKYFYDLVDAMQPIRTGKPSISLDDLEQEVGGKIIREHSDALVYQDTKSGKKYTLPLTSTGVVQLAFLEHLVATQVIKKNSVVFFDEPEAHLHPAWQIIMMKSLFNLAKQDVNIIFASHSPDNVQWLRNKLHADPEVNKLIGINHFKKDGDIKLDADKNITCDSILEEITDPFAEEYYKGL